VGWSAFKRVAVGKGGVDQHHISIALPHHSLLIHPSASPNHKRCYDCTLSRKPCASCALGASMWGTGPPDIGGCLRCVARNGQAVAAQCSECAQSRAPTRCFSCLDSKYNLKVCADAKTGEPEPPLGSCRAKGAPTPCAVCANGAASDAVFSACLGCYEDPNRDQECAGCVQTAEGAGDQARCFGCVATAGFTSYKHYGCAQCFSGWVGAVRRDGCLACAEAAATPAAAKRYCSTCADGSGARAAADGRGRCVACLQSKQREEKRDWNSVCVGNGYGRRLRSESGGLFSSASSWFYRGES